MYLIIDKLCPSIDRIHEKLVFYKDINSDQRYIQLIDKKTNELRYYPIYSNNMYHEHPNLFSVGFESYLNEGEVFVLYKIAGELYHPGTLKKYQQ